MDEKEDIIEMLLEAPCRVIDILPKQVPAEGGKRYFEFEKYMEKPPFINEIYGRFSAVLMKLNCYYDMVVTNDPEKDGSLNPNPENLCKKVESCIPSGDGAGYFYALIEDRALIMLSGGDLYMTVYGPDEEMIEILEALTASEGFFLRKPEA